MVIPKVMVHGPLGREPSFVSNPAILSEHLFITSPINAYLFKCSLGQFYHLTFPLLTNDLNKTHDTITFLTF